MLLLIVLVYLVLCERLELLAVENRKQQKQLETLAEDKDEIENDDEEEEDLEQTVGHFRIFILGCFRLLF